MTKVNWNKKLNKYNVLFLDGTYGLISKFGIENLFPNTNWEIVKENDHQWFYI